jgi:hypothetical protein
MEVSGHFRVMTSLLQGLETPYALGLSLSESLEGREKLFASSDNKTPIPRTTDA